MCPEANKSRLPCPTTLTAYLNSGTLLVYPQKFTGDIRSVYLIGEANFDVKKDKQHPFIVKTNHLKVKVLGTKFNVHAYAEDEKTTTTLESGSVVVQKANNEDIITPHTQRTTGI
ncbi:FecR family protein [Bacteroides thetaiotaomicron]|nr:FecR family protein [Bacteroides thetaiotaomicron]